MESLIAKNKATANRLYQAARESTKGQPVQSQTLDQVMETPIGKQAFAWAKVQKGNRNSELPTIDVQPEAASGFSPEQWSDLMGRMKERGMDMPSAGTREVPDPETLHFMKQYLAKVSRLGVRDGQGGAIATQAQGALQQWGSIRNELPPIWRKADEATAEGFRLEDMMNEGRNVFRTRENPTGTRARGAVQKSLGALTSRATSATPEQQQALQTGAGMAAQARWNAAPGSIRSPGRVFDFASPERAQQMGHAFTSPEAGQGFQREVAAWDRAAQQAERLTGNSRTAGRAAEEAGRGISPSALMHLATGHPALAARQAIGTIGSVVGGKNRGVLDAEIARLLTSGEAKTLEQATQTALLRQRLRDFLSTGTAMTGVNMTQP